MKGINKIPQEIVEQPFCSDKNVGENEKRKYVCSKCGFDNTALWEIFLIPIAKEVAITETIKQTKLATLKEVLKEFDKAGHMNNFRIWLEKEIKKT